MQARGNMKTALVTGGARGIGAAISKALARDGWHVYVNYAHSEKEALALAREIGGEAVYADVTVSESVRALFERIGAVDLLVNNAGVAWYGLLQDMSDADWQRIFSCDTDGVFRTCRAAIPGMVKKQSGCIVNISSVWGVYGASCEAAYSAAKGAVISLTRALAKELGPSGIRVNAVCPGVIGTDMLSCFSDADKAALAADTPLGRLGTPEDVAETVAFLASDRAAFITGQILGCDGGFGL